VLEDEGVDGLGPLDGGEVRGGRDRLEACTRDGGGDRALVLGRRRGVRRAGDDERRGADAAESARRSIRSMAPQQAP
jgi:hypothetical protein